MSKAIKSYVTGQDAGKYYQKSKELCTAKGLFKECVYELFQKVVAARIEIQKDKHNVKS